MARTRKEQPSFNEFYIEDLIDKAFEFDAVPGSAIGAKDNRNQSQKISDLCAQLGHFLDNSKDPSQNLSIRDRLNIPYAIVRELTQKKAEALRQANGVVAPDVLGNINELIEESLIHLGSQTTFLTQAALHPNTIGLSTRNVALAILATNSTEAFGTLIHVMEIAKGITSPLIGTSSNIDRGRLQFYGREAAWNMIDEWRASDAYRSHPFSNQNNSALEIILYTGFGHTSPNYKRPPLSEAFIVPQLGEHIHADYRSALGLIAKPAPEELVQPTLPGFIKPPSQERRPGAR